MTFLLMCLFNIFFLLDQDQINTSDLKLEDNNRKSSAVTEAMMSTVDEETKKLEKSAEDSSDEIVKPVEGQVITDTIQEVSVNAQSEHREAKNTSEDCIKVLFICIFTIV